MQFAHKKQLFVDYNNPNDKQFLMIRSCNVAIYYRLLIYSDLVVG